MTEKDKELLLKDLCTRLPYGVKVNINSSIEEQNSMKLFDVDLDSETIGVSNDKWVFRAIPIIDDEDEVKVIKPYLRPMSSMTDDERRALLKWGTVGLDENGKVFDVYPYGMKRNMAVIDFLNARHFDYRGLIEKGLALEAPEGMYKNG